MKPPPVLCGAAINNEIVHQKDMHSHTPAATPALLPPLMHIINVVLFFLAVAVLLHLILVFGLEAWLERFGAVDDGHEPSRTRGAHKASAQEPHNTFAFGSGALRPRAGCSHDAPHDIWSHFRLEKRHAILAKAPVRGHGKRKRVRRR